jgi:hypothetical protein
MVYASFILALWPGLLAAAGLAGQLVFSAIGKSNSVSAVSAGYEAVLERPYFAIAVAFVLLILPVIISLAISLWRIYKTGRYENLIVAAVALDAFSLLYYFFLYDAFLR